MVVLKLPWVGMRSQTNFREHIIPARSRIIRSPDIQFGYRKYLCKVLSKFWDPAGNKLPFLDSDHLNFVVQWPILCLSERAELLSRSVVVNKTLLGMEHCE